MFKIEFGTGNSAFDDGFDGTTEAAKILKNIAAKLENGMATRGTVMDSNGNAIGEWSYTPDLEDDYEDEAAFEGKRVLGFGIKETQDRLSKLLK